MLYIDQIRPREPVKIPGHLKSGIAKFDEYLSIKKAEKLLQTTRQLNKWLLIRQENFTKAAHIARLVLDRHDYIAGRKPANETGRRHFDQLTERLKSEGIHLYKSEQFEYPIFNLKNTIENETPFPPSRNSPADISKVHRLNNRYHRKDCLEFVAGILEENGLSYYGENGIAKTLIRKAGNQNKKHNAYLTGEGVTGLLCDNPFSIRVPNDSPQSFESVWNTIKPHIESGAILSFSSQHFGHTGIVDHIGGRWTYINSSGVMGKPNSYRVLAEDLKHEIQSWLKRARLKNTFLDITIGKIDPELSSGFHKPAFTARNAEKPDVNLMA